MAQMQFPPGNWNQTANIVDTIVLEYTSSWPGVNLTLFCETVKGTGDWLWWNLKGPLPASASYNLHLDLFRFSEYINIFPTACHFDLVNSKNGQQKVNGGWIPLTSIKNKAETTWARYTTATSAGATSTRSNLPSPTAVSSGTSTISAGVVSTGMSATSDASRPVGLSKTARIGIGVGAGLGFALLVILAVLAMMLYRRRRRTRGAQVAQVTGSTKYEKAELLGHPVTQPQVNEMPASIGSLQPKQAGAGSEYDTSGRSSPWGPPQELLASTSYSPWQVHERNPGQRYELGS